MTSAECLLFGLGAQCTLCVRHALPMCASRSPCGHGQDEGQLMDVRPGAGGWGAYESVVGLVRRQPYGAHLRDRCSAPISLCTQPIALAAMSQSCIDVLNDVGLCSALLTS